MSDVLLVSLPGESSRVAPIVAGLRTAGLSVWSDADLAGGEDRHRVLADELAAAKCVVVVWTTASVGSELVRDVATRALERRVLLPVRLDRVDAPVTFGQLRTLDLTGWNGKLRHRRFREVVKTVQAIVAGRPQPGVAGTRRGWWAALVTAVPVVLTILGFFADLQAVSQPLCRVPGINAVCAHWGLGGVPTPEEAAAWAARTPGDCAALRVHLTRFPGGAYAEEASRRYQAAEPKPTESWIPNTLPVQLRVRITAAPLASEAAARTDALTRSGPAAEEACAAFRYGEYRLRRATAEVVAWDCFERPGGVVCGFNGKALCEVDVRRSGNEMICP